MTSPGVAVTGALALVTGAGSGIGRATSLELAARGARVLCADIDEARAEQTAKLCREAGAAAEAFEADVADRDSVARLAEEVHLRHGPLDVLVNNAGVGVSGTFLDTPLDDWSWILGVNLMGVVHCCHAFGGEMIARGRGHVVNVASGLAYTHRSTEPAYVSSKAAVLALSRALRADWRPHGVGVTAVCPGVVDTPIIRHTRFRGDSAAPERVARAQRLFARGHAPDTVARAIVRTIGGDRAVVPVGFESWLSWLLHRLLPVRAADGVVAGTHRLTSP